MRRPRTHNSFGDRSFSAVGPRVWNALPSYLRQDVNLYRSIEKDTVLFRLQLTTAHRDDLFSCALEAHLLTYVLT